MEVETGDDVLVIQRSSAKVDAVVCHALAQMRSSGIRGAIVEPHNASRWSCSMRASRGISNDGTVRVSVDLLSDLSVVAIVRTTFTSASRRAPEAAAFAALVQEMTAFAVCLQAELDQRIKEQK